MARRIDVKRTVPPRPRCSFCFRQSRGEFVRVGRKSLYGCYRHFGKGMRKLAKHYYSRSAGG